jgi:hypothetical protein
MSKSKFPPKSEYSKLLLDPRWQKKRLEILNRDEWICQYCFADERTLHVHHKYYIYNKKPWEYDNNVLITLCDSCHSAEGGHIKYAQQQLLRAFARRGFLSLQLYKIAEALESLPEFQGVNEPGADELSFSIVSEDCQRMFWDDMRIKMAEAKKIREAK